MTLQEIADDLGLDVSDVSTTAAWLRSHDDDHILVGAELDRAVRAVLDPDGERTDHAHASPARGRRPGP